MLDNLLAFIPMDRRQAMAAGRQLPTKATGAALFADISGFTSLTETLVRELGPQRGADELTVYLNRVYDALIDELHRRRGSAVAFAGDAVTCWFDDGDARGSGVHRATAAALAMQTAMEEFRVVRTPVGGRVSLSMKASLAAGTVSRLLVGDPGVHVWDAIAGATMERLAAAELLAGRGEVVLAPCAARALAGAVTVTATRYDGSGGAYAVVEQLPGAPAPAPWPPLPAGSIHEHSIKPWLLPEVYDRIRRGSGEFLAELRPTAALFMRFDGIDYERDPQAGAKLDGCVRWMQSVVERYEGVMFDINLGDKGGYFYICFGAPVAHEDDAERAAATALALRQLPDHFDYIRDLRMGLSQGRMRVGPYGGRAHRTYGVLGDEVNMAARLMTAARPGQILAGRVLQRTVENEFQWRPLPAIRVKGREQPVAIAELVAAVHREQLVRPGADHLLPLVGRRTELAQVTATLSAALRGQGQILGIGGSPGIGKSRFVSEAIRVAQGLGYRVYGGACEAYGVNTSYLVWQPIWRSLFQADGKRAVAERLHSLEKTLAGMDPILRRRAPLLGAVLGLPVPDNDLTRAFEPKLRKESLEDLLAECLRAFSREHPLLLVLEECQWLDALSRDLVDTLARALADLPVVILLAYRPATTNAELMTRLRGLSYFDELELEELQPDELRELARLRLQQLELSATVPDLPDEFLDRLIHQAEGNPFYLEELIGFVHGYGIDAHDELALTQLELPSSLQSLVLSRLDQLTDSQKTALKIASVFGRNFRADWMTDIYPDLGDRGAVHEDLVRVTERGLTVPDTVASGTTGTGVDVNYRFKHVITRDVIYASLLHMLRVSLHEQIGMYIEARYADSVDSFLDVLAHHYGHSENSGKQREYLRRAGKAAQDEYANDAAIDYYRRLLPLLDQADQAEVLLQLGKVEQLVGNWDEAARHYDQARARAEAAGDDALIPWCKLAVGDLARLQSNYADAALWLEAARADFAQLGQTDGVAQVLHLSGTLAAQQGDYARARQDFQTSMALRRSLNDQDGIARLLNNLAIIALYEEDTASARRLHEEGLTIRRELGDQATIANSLGNLANVLLEEGSVAEARALMEEAIQLQRQIGDRWGTANTLNNLGNAARAGQEYDTAAALYAESMTIVRRLGDRWALAYLLEDMGTVIALRGEPARGLALVGAAQALRVEIGSPLPPADQETLDGLLAPLRAELGAEVAARMQAAGVEMGVEEAVALASCTI